MDAVALAWTLQNKISFWLFFDNFSLFCFQIEVCFSSTCCILWPQTMTIIRDCINISILQSVHLNVIIPTRYNTAND